MLSTTIGENYTTRIATAIRPTDYVLADWAQAGLRFPSALKLVLFTLAPARVEHHIGALTTRDLTEVDRRLRRALALEVSLNFVLSEIDFVHESPHDVQALAEKALVALKVFAEAASPDVNLDRLRELLAKPDGVHKEK